MELETSDSADAMQHSTVDLAPIWMMVSLTAGWQAASWIHSLMLFLDVAHADETRGPIVHLAPCCSEIASGTGRTRSVGEGWTDTLGGEIAVSA